MRILFVNDYNRNEVQNPLASLVRVNWENYPNSTLVAIAYMSSAENKQNRVERSGGS